MAKKLYSVYDNKMDLPVVTYAPSYIAAKKMGITIQSFYCAVSRTKTGGWKRWKILVHKEE